MYRYDTTYYIDDIVMYIKSVLAIIARVLLIIMVYGIYQNQTCRLHTSGLFQKSTCIVGLILVYIY